jgi:hypothetical protein
MQFILIVFEPHGIRRWLFNKTLFQSMKQVAQKLLILIKKLFSNKMLNPNE